MDFGVFFIARKNEKIFGGIIFRISINVVDSFFRRQEATDLFFGDKDMLVNISVRFMGAGMTGR